MEINKNEPLFEPNPEEKYAMLLNEITVAANALHELRERSLEAKDRLMRAYDARDSFLGTQNPQRGW